MELCIDLIKKNIRHELCAFTQVLAFAVGYYEGRANGHGDVIHRPEWIDAKPILTRLYKEGYEKGVSDYCTFDIEEEAD